MGKGRPRKPTKLLKEKGTFRADRHAARADLGPLDGAPVRPAGLTHEEAKAWDMIVAGLPVGILAGVDSLALESCCKVYAASMVAYSTGDLVSFVKLDAAFCRWCSRFGITPTDRAKLNAPEKKEDETNPFKILDALTRESA